MNPNRRVLHLVLYSTGLFLLLSIGAIWLKFDWLPFQRVNLVSDVLHNRADSLVTENTKKDSLDQPVIVEVKPALDFNLYTRPRTISSFSTDSSKASLERFVRKLYALQHGQPVKVRIAYFGDSMIEGDLLTQTLRELLQKQFGGNGVGFVPVTSAVSKFRQTVNATYSNTWTDDNFKESKTNRLYLSGHSFHSDNAWVQMTDQTSYDSGALVEKSLLYGPSPGHPQVRVNGQPVTLPGTQPVNRTVLAKSEARSVRLDVADNSLPVYGISFESPSGIFVDNFSFRGITGIEFAKIDSAFLHAIATENPYDLIVFQYGVNLLFRPNDKNFSWYARTMLPILRKIRHSFADADFVLVSTADRAFRYAGEYRSAVGIDSLVKAQAILAYETGSAFYNQFASMGGTNSIVDWARQKPSLANQDYVHPNHRGAAILGNYFYEAIMKEYYKYSKSAGATP